MKVLNPGPFNTSTIICGHCGALLEYVRNDVKEAKTKPDYLGDSEDYRYLQCGQCQKEIRVP